MGRNQLDLGRFAEPALLILISLADQPRHGYAMMEDIVEFSGVKLGPGTLYGAIARLEERGFIEAVDSGDRRRPYRITDVGRTALAEHLDNMTSVTTAGLQRISQNGKRAS
jgi:DNA-binding PadR family transcriptional regulator